MSRLEDALQKQIDLNSAKNLLHDRLEQVIEMDPALLAVLEELLEDDGENLPELTQQQALSFASGALIERLYAINQFLQVDEEKRRSLERIYARTWQKIIQSRNINTVLKNYHFPALKRWITGLYPEAFIEHLRPHPTIGHVVRGEYSPILQIRLLHIDLQSLREPVLDIGCGPSARLVHYLRRVGKEAFGLDRHVESASAHIRQANWLSYRFEPSTWGTITSNMGFTNHFLYVFHHDSSQFGLYWRKFHEIVESLMPGGSFHYAPGIPLVEEELEPNRYQVERSIVVQDISMTKITRIAE